MIDDGHIARLSVAALRGGYARQDVSPTDVLEAFAARIARRNQRLNAYLDLRLDGARREAMAAVERLRTKRQRSLIDGVPFAVKANISIAGLPLHAGIAAYRGDVAKADAACVSLLRRAGAIPLGIVNMHEGALGATTDNPHFGRTHNPWREGLTPGGSSGGSAASVAAGLCAFALGTDTMGSVRIPSAYCGIAGFKPTRGLISGAGLLELSPTLDHVGVHASSAADLCDVMSAFGVQAAPAATVRIGVAKWGARVSVEPAIVEAFDAAVGVLRTLARTVQVDISDFDFGALRRRGLLISEWEGFRIHKRKLAESRDGFSPEFAGMLEWGASQPTGALETAHAEIGASAARFSRFFDQVDIVALPTTPQGPFAFGAEVPASQADLTCMANFGGFPAAAVPATVVGAPPPSIQFIGRLGADAQVLGLALAFEEARGPAPRPQSY